MKERDSLNINRPIVSPGTLMLMGATSSGWRTLTSGLIVYRRGPRDGKYVIDYSDNGGVTWTLDLVNMEPDEDLAVILAAIDPDYRCQVRDGAFMLDNALTETGFAGSENIDWENIYSTIPV